MTEPNLNDLTQGAIGRTLVRMTMPMIMGTLSMVLFNLADTFFVGLLGTRELAALSFTFPVVMVLHSIAVGLGTGTTAVLSRAVGEGGAERVKRLTTDGILLGVVIVAVFSVIGIVTIDPLFTVLGAPADILPAIKQYMTIWYIGLVFVIIPMIGNGAMRAAGDTKSPGVIMTFAAASNVVLDPILIFGWGVFPRMEVVGAAVATVFSRALSLVFALWVIHSKKHMIATYRPRIGEILRSWREILYIAAPTALTRGITPLATGIITAILARYSAEAVAAYGVAQRIEFLALTIIVSFAVIFGPFSGQNLGAGRPERVWRGLSLGYRFSILSGVATYLVLAIAGPWLALVFTRNEAVVAGIVLFLRIVPAGYALFGIFHISVNVMYALHRPLHAAALSALQMFVLCIPLTFLGSWLFGIPGVYGALAIAYTISGLLAYWALPPLLHEFSRDRAAADSA